MLCCSSLQESRSVHQDNRTSHNVETFHNDYLVLAFYQNVTFFWIAHAMVKRRHKNG